jgi:hypothetical protein
MNIEWKKRHFWYPPEHTDYEMEHEGWSGAVYRTGDLWCASLMNKSREQHYFETTTLQFAQEFIRTFLCEREELRLLRAMRDAVKRDGTPLGIDAERAIEAASAEL